ncbi:MAG TPA: hypothetical protein VF746_24045 [Longimicrobium sp.]
MNDRLPVRFQARVRLQALSNALRRPTSDRLKLLRLTVDAVGVLDRAELAEEMLRTRLHSLRAALEAERALDRDEYATALDNCAAAISWTPIPIAPRLPVASA